MRYLAGAYRHLDGRREDVDCAAEFASGGDPLATKPFAFVLMPFDDSFGDIYKLGIQAVATECGVIAERVDEQTYSETMLERIYRQIDIADFIIADMTGKNPNVFYEVGYAHAKGKLCTLLTQSPDDIPFDLKHHRHIIYDGSIQTLKKKLKSEIKWLKSEREKQTTKPFTIELKSYDGQLVATAYSATAEMEFTFDITNKTKVRSPEIEAIYVYTGDAWKLTNGGRECPSVPTDEKRILKHFIQSPLPRLSPGSWMQVKMEGKKVVWSKFSGDDLEEKYRLSGYMLFEIVTSDGNFIERLELDSEVEEVPF